MIVAKSEHGAVMNRTVNAMTVDVEDYFQVSAFEPHFAREDWCHIPGRVDANTNRILDLFDSHGVKATFFFLGCVAERHPGLVRKITETGHEIASHGWQHVRVSDQNPSEFREDVRRTRLLLEDISGQPVTGYRAASFSIGPMQTWAWNELASAGYQYSSSVVPIHHDHYGMPEASRFAFFTEGRAMLEVPVSTVSLGGRKINCGGGGWFRLFPYKFSRWAINHVNTVDGQPGVFYIHPWEVDPDQPRPEGLSLKTRFRHYVNLRKTYPRLERLLTDFNWGRMDQVFLQRESA